VVKKYNMDIKEAEKIADIVKDYKNKSNKDIVKVLDFLNTEFDETKSKILMLSNYLDKIEGTYNTILKEHNSRNGG
jgi:hypothetical protein